MLHLDTFGGLVLRSRHSELTQPRRRLALLACVAASGTRGVSRDELLALFWAERDIETARHSLDQLLYELRRSLGASPTVGTTTLRLDPGVVGSDADEWRLARDRGDLAAAVALYRGPFLHGFYLHGAPEFERWVEVVRARLATEYRADLEALATAATTEGRNADAVVWWRKLVGDDRLSSRVALGLMHSLADAGDRAGALEFARTHERLVWAELESAPDPAVAAFAESLRGSPVAPTTPPAAETPQTIIIPSAAASPGAGFAGENPRGGRRRRMSAKLALATLAIVSAMYIAAARRTGRQTSASSKDDSAPTRPGTTNIAAHDLYRRAKDPTLLRSDSGVQAAIGLLSRAVALDSTFAPAYASLAGLHATATWGTTLSLPERRESLIRGDAAARRAILLDDSLADAHAQLGYILLLQFRPLAAGAELERAIALDPKDGASSELLTKVYEWTDRPDAAVAEARRGVRANPVSPSMNAELGDALYFARHYDEALAQLRKVSGVQPPLRRVPGYLAEVYIATQRWSDAIAVLRPVAGRQPSVRGLLGYALARSGARADATRLLREMLEDESAGRAPAMGVAEIYLGLGDRERAFVWMERAFDDYSLRAGVMGPVFDSLRVDPRFRRVRERLALPL